MTGTWFDRFIVVNNIVDEVDAAIIRNLQSNARQTTQSIADKVGIKRPTAHERIKKLQEMKIINGFTTELNYARCGLPLRVFILVGYDSTTAGDMNQKDIAKQLSRLEHVVSVDIITGSYDFLVEVVIDLMDQLADVIIEEIRQIKGVGGTQSLISFKHYKNGHETTKQRF